MTASPRGKPRTQKPLDITIQRGTVLRDCGIFLNILKGGFLSEYCNPSGTVVRGAGRTAESAEPNPGNAVFRLPRIVQRPGPGL